jgi:hypothetical protein
VRMQGAAAGQSAAERPGTARDALPSAAARRRQRLPHVLTVFRLMDLIMVACAECCSRATRS